MAEWIEARLKPGREPRELYDHLADRPPKHTHHFWDEPWWPGAYVVRVRGATRARIEKCAAVHHAVKWDASPDEESYARYWGWAQQFFEAGSMLSLGAENRLKFVHCFLNAHGMSQRQEAWWALGFFWDRLTIGLRWRLYLRRRYERQQEAE